MSRSKALYLEQRVSKIYVLLNHTAPYWRSQLPKKLQTEYYDYVSLIMSLCGEVSSSWAKKLVKPTINKYRKRYEKIKENEAKTIPPTDK